MGDVELVILAGLQASGKSTFRRERFPGHVVVSKDLMRNNRHKERRQRQLVEEALADGHSVVVDNTNPAREDRRPLVEIGRRYGTKVLAYYFVPDLKASFARNSARAARELVPPAGLIAVRRRLEPPAAEEGFDEIWLVRAAEGEFEVAPLPTKRGVPGGGDAS